jgi:hypothetical protein
MLTPKKFYEPKLMGAEKALAERHCELQNIKEKRNNSAINRPN